MRRGASLTRSCGLKRTRLKRRKALKRSGPLKRKSTLRSKTSKSGTGKTSEQLRAWRSQPRRCLVCGLFPCDPHHRVPQSRPQDLPTGLDMDAPENLTPLCREHHAEYGHVMGEPTSSILHRDAMLANAQTWLARHPGCDEALPGWLVEALEE